MTIKMSSYHLTKTAIQMKNDLPDQEKCNVGTIRLHDNGLKRFICEHCGKVCKTSTTLKEHQLVHTNECPFECEVCHKRFKNKPRLKSHMDIHNKSLYKCEYCDMTLNTRRTLRQHRLVHTDEKRFKCEFCDAAFKRSKGLKNHLILHTGLKPYKCNFCDKTFSNGSNCRGHKKRVHPKELADEEADGKVVERVPIPKLEELISAKGILVQPQQNDNEEDPEFEYDLTKSGVNETESIVDNQGEESDESVIYEIIIKDDPDTPADNNDTYSDFPYYLKKSEVDEIESIADNQGEECEVKVKNEIIDEI